MEGHHVKTRKIVFQSDVPLSEVRLPGKVYKYLWAFSVWSNAMTMMSLQRDPPMAKTPIVEMASIPRNCSRWAALIDLPIVVSDSDFMVRINPPAAVRIELTVGDER
jgi:hypothetical protein